MLRIVDNVGTTLWFVIRYGSLGLVRQRISWRDCDVCQ